ncbi:MAG: protein kinase [Vulcanimicrobiota bacterium]
MPPARSFRRRLAGWLTVAALALTPPLSQARPWLPWDRYLFDRNLEWRHGELPSQYPLMAHLSLKELDLQHWQTLRQEYDGLASLVESCREQGAAVIILDVLITRGSDSDLKNLWKQVYRQPDVILVRGLGESIRLPGPQKVAIANLQRDWDGIIRHYKLYYPEEDSPSLAWLTYLRLKRLKDQATEFSGGELRAGQKSFPNELYFQPRTAWSEYGSNIQFVSVKDLERWQAAGESMLEGKAVFVGYVSPGVGDLASTVLDPAHPKIGIHATVLSNLMQERYYTRPGWLVPVLGGWACLLAGSLLSRLRPWMALVLIPCGLFLASQQALWGKTLLPWTSWALACLTGLALTLLWKQRNWRWNLEQLQQTADFQNPLLFKRLGSYLLVEKLGEGGFGAVYRALPAQSLDEGSAVAVKLFRCSDTTPEEERRRFLREARICSELRHPGIVRVLECGEELGYLFYTMEWVRGRNLRYWLRETHSLAEKLAVLAEVVRAVGYAHKHGVLHRDLKPENIVLEGSQPKVVDFGLAIDPQSSQLTSTHSVLGTLGYLSPERLSGVSNDARADQYALGVIGYEMLAGRSPFPDLPVGEAVAWRLSEFPTPLVQLLGQDQPIYAVVDQMMARDPSARFANLTEVSEALQSALGHL